MAYSISKLIPKNWRNVWR